MNIITTNASNVPFKSISDLEAELEKKGIRICGQIAEHVFIYEALSSSTVIPKGMNTLQHKGLNYFFRLDVNPQDVINALTMF